MSLSNIFQLGYYFDYSAGYTFPGFWAVLIVLLAVFVASLAASFKISKLKKISGHQRDLWKLWVNLGYVLSLVGLFWLFVRYQGIAYLNWRFWPALLILGVLIWAGYLIYLQKKVLPKKLARREREVSMAQYFRKRGKKK